MKKLIASSVLALALAASAVPALAQGYGYGGYGGYGYQDYDRRDHGYDRRRYHDHGYDDYRGPRRRAYGFDAAEYLRCNPDVRRAVRANPQASAEEHYRIFGRREGRRLTC